MCVGGGGCVCMVHVCMSVPGYIQVYMHVWYEGQRSLSGFFFNCFSSFLRWERSLNLKFPLLSRLAGQGTPGIYLSPNYTSLRSQTNAAILLDNLSAGPCVCSAGTLPTESSPLKKLRKNVMIILTTDHLQPNKVND